MQGGGGGEVEGVPLFTGCPSFREEASEVPPPEYAAADDDSDEDSDFEFAFVIQDPEIGPGISADEIFSNGQIRTVYPVFNRALLFANDDGYGDDYGDRLAPAPAEEEGEEEKTEMIRGTLRRLLMEDRGENPGSASSSSSSTATDELDGISPATYCVWAPNPSASPSRCRKSRSTGSSLRWRLRDLVVGRSHSDGKEKFVFFAAEDKTKTKKKTKTKTKAKETETPRREATPAAEKPKEGARARVTNATALDVVTAHQIYYGKAGPAGGGPAAARRSFLPYKQDLVGFFASVNGITRTHHPF